MAAKTFLKSTLVISLFFGAFALSEPAHAKNIYVDDNGPADFSNIQAAIDDANDGDNIIVNPGTYTGEGNRDIDFLGKAITVRSTDPCDPSIVAATIIDCNGTAGEPHRGFYFHSGEGLDSVLRGVTIRNGFGLPDLWSCGGGIFCQNSSPTISNCIIEDNTADNDDAVVAPGGGIYLRNSSPNIFDCAFINNYAESGGAIGVNYLSDPTISNCIIIGNTTEFYGAGICSFGSSMISHCVIMHNSAGNYGGGIYGELGNQKINNCLISGNSADEFGGGIGYGYSTLTIKDSTITGNSANISGGGVDFYFYCSAIISNCILWDNNADSGSEISIRYPHSPSDITVKYSDVQGGENTIYVAENSTLEWGPGNIDTDPFFLNPDNNNYHLLPDSHCINAGDPNYTAGPNETDLDGIPRVICDRIDMGAYEFQGLRILFVDADAGGANDGSSWEDAYNYLQDALAACCSSDEIRVAQGIYKPDQGAGITPGDREATFQLINGVTIKGGYAGLGQPDPNARDIQLYKTILTGAGNSYHVVTGSRTDETAVLDGFTVTGGNANAKWPEKDDSGSGMFNHNGSPRLANCTFKGNKAYYGAGIYNVSSIRPPMLTNCIISDNWAYNYGGGIYNKNCSPILTNCTFSDNKASDGAGMYNMSNRSMLRNCAFINNWASEGGGMYNRHDGNPTLTNCTFSGNSANFYGGGMANRHSSPTMTNCIFSRNSADAGGGIRNLDSNPTLRNCIFSGNSAYEGGGMFCAFSSPTLINCTLSGNSASDYGGGIYGEDSSNPTLTNCTLWGNSDSEIESSAVITYSDIKGGWPGIGNIDTDPLFIDPGYWDANGVWTDGDYRLLPDSPCIDAGDPNYIAGPDETDLDGKPRIVSGRIDMGPYEFSPSILAEVRIVPRTINLASKGKWITCYIWLPEEYDVADIEPNSIFLEDEVKPELFSVDEQAQVATVRFAREDVQPILEVGDIGLTITGRLTDGTFFTAADTVKVIKKAGKK